MIKKKACTAVDKAFCLLAIELNLGEGDLEHIVANSAAERKANSIVRFEVRMEELRKIRNLPPPQAQGGRPKEDLDSDRPTNDRVVSAGEDRSKSEDSMPQGDSGKQIQDMQDKADFISKLQRELQQEVQAFKLKRLQDRGIKSEVVYT